MTDFQHRHQYHPDYEKSNDPKNTKDRKKGQPDTSWGIIGVFSDISKTRALEQEQLRALQTIAETESRRAEEAENHEKEQLRFVDIVCHEIRNPLNGILNNVDMLLENRKAIIANLRVEDMSIPQNVTKVLHALETEEVFWNAIDLCMNHQVYF